MTEKLEVGKKYRTIKKPHLPARVLADDVKNSTGGIRPVVAVENEIGGEAVYGGYNFDGTLPAYPDLDLEPVPETVTKWVNFYGAGAAVAYEDETRAKLLAEHEYAIAVAVPVTFDVGYGVKK